MCCACRADYLEAFAPKCAGCNEYITDGRVITTGACAVLCGMSVLVVIRVVSSLHAHTPTQHSHVCSRTPLNTHSTDTTLTVYTHSNDTLTHTHIRRIGRRTAEIPRRLLQVRSVRHGARRAALHAVQREGL